MMGSMIRGVAVGAALVATAWLSACSGSGRASVDARVADARVSRAVPPGAPLGLEIALVDGTCVASWRPPVDDGGAPVTGYIVTTEIETPTATEPGPDIGTAATARRTPAPPASIVRMALPQSIRIAARNLAGDGPEGEPATC